MRKPFGVIIKYVYYKGPEHGLPKKKAFDLVIKEIYSMVADDYRYIVYHHTLGNAARKCKTVKQAMRVFQSIRKFSGDAGYFRGEGSMDKSVEYMRVMRHHIYYEEAVRKVKEL